MRRVDVSVLSILVFFAVVGSVPPAAAGKDEAPEARNVVVRGKEALDDALSIAARPAWAEPRGRPFLLVVDVTPNTKRARPALREALLALEAKGSSVPTWSVAALGRRPTDPVDTVSELIPWLGDVFQEETDAASTLTALDATLRQWRTKQGVVVYLADWHFEDDVELEDFIRGLERKDRTLSVVGSEAAWGRAWTDGLRSGTDMIVQGLRGLDFRETWEGIGRNPFRADDESAPWHGGDTAYPHAPYRWGHLLWRTTFSAVDWELADVAEAGADLDGSGGLARKLLELQEAIDGLEKEIDRAPETERPALEVRLQELRSELEAVLKALASDLPFPPEMPGEAGGEETEVAALEAEVEALEDEVRRHEDRLSQTQSEVERKVLRARLEATRTALEDARTRLARARTAAAPADPEDLRDRLPGGAPDPAERPDILTDEDPHREYPLPSSWGPYGLMRAAGMTGGRYVLWSWNPKGRKTVQYDYARCSLFPPDLRPRDAILRDLRRNEWAHAMLRAWHALVETETRLVDHTPPVDERLRKPRSIERTPPTSWSLIETFDNRSDLTRWRKSVERALEGLDDAYDELDDAIEKGGDPPHRVAQRYHADALLLRHVVALVRFQLRERLVVAKAIDPHAWKRADEGPSIHGRTWVREGRDPERIRRNADVRPHDEEEAERLLAERRMLLERFRGTPIAEVVALNTIDTAEVGTWHRAYDIPETGRSPSESIDVPKPVPGAPPGGGSGGSGPTSGGP